MARGQRTDRMLFLEEEIREEVLEQWRRQGLSRDVDAGNYREFFSIDRMDYLYLDIAPRSGPLRAGADFERIEEGFRSDLPDFRRHSFWDQKAVEYCRRDFPLGVTGWRGFMLPLFAREREWDSLQDVLLALYDHPGRVKSSLAVVAETYRKTISLALEHIEFDFGVILEPIASRSGPIISPEMFREFVLPHHKEMVEFFHSRGVEVVVFKASSNVLPILPSVIESGVDGLWISQTGDEVDYADLRAKYPDTLLIGGIDARILTRDGTAIAEEVQRRVAPLLDKGRYLPGLDDRPRENWPLRGYQAYREALRECCCLPR